MAHGKVIIGFSALFAALYNRNGTNVTYSNGIRAARGVDVSLAPETSGDNNFFADGVVAESDGGKFTGGTAKYTVDGLHDAAERFIYGLPEPEEVPVGADKKVKIIKYGKKAKPPYLGVGFVIWYQSDDVVTYQPMILPKVKFKPHGTDAKTQEGEKNWQTLPLESTIFRDDTPDHNWKWLLEEQSTEEEAIAILMALLSVAEDAEPEEAAEPAKSGEEGTNG